MSVEGMHNYFIQKLSRDDSRDKVSADELTDENEACSRKLHDIHFFVLFIFEQICERNMFSKRLVLSQRGCRAAFFGLQNVQRGFATSSGIVLCSFYGSIPVNQYFLPRLVEGRPNVHDLLGFGSHNSLQDRTY